MTFTLGAILLVVAAVLFIVQPLLTGDTASLERTEDEMTEAESKRRVKLLALRDVEYDYATGKLDEADYQELRRELSAEALAALAEVDEEGVEAVAAGARSSAADLEREIVRVRQGLREGLVCGACGHFNRPHSRFCSGCGQPLPTATAAED